jgi:hypothetical protein
LVLLNTGVAVAQISFTGDDGANLLQNAGTVTQSITFAGGSDAGSFSPLASSVTSLHGTSSAVITARTQV